MKVAIHAIDLAYVLPPPRVEAVAAFALEADAETTAASASETASGTGSLTAHGREVGRDVGDGAAHLAREIELVRSWVDERESWSKRPSADASEDHVYVVIAPPVPIVVTSSPQGHDPERAVPTPSANVAPARQTPTEAIVVNVRTTRDGTVATLELRHRSLGPIHMELTITGSRMIVHATAVHAHAVAALAASEQELRASVREQGLELHLLRVGLERRRKTRGGSGREAQDPREEL